MSANGPEFNPAMQADEPLTPFDVTRASDRSGLFKLALGMILLLVIAFVVLKIYQPGVRDRGDPPLITADNTPFKITPDDPGGLQVPDQDKEVFDMMSGSQPDRDIVTLPVPETPREQPVQPEETMPVDPTDPISVEPLQPADTPPASVRQDPDPDPDPVVTEPDPAPVVPFRQPVGTVSDWVVQVASLRSQAEAEATYDRIAARNTSMRGYERDIVRVDLAEKGIYYRARISGFSSKSDADSLCGRLKAAGQACFVTRR
ncbi:MAG: SPOR domain-containing protein [Pseudomonadota bacterium]